MKGGHVRIKEDFIDATFCRGIFLIFILIGDSFRGRSIRISIGIFYGNVVNVDLENDGDVFWLGRKGVTLYDDRGIFRSLAYGMVIDGVLSLCLKSCQEVIRGQSSSLANFVENGRFNFR